MLQSVSLCTCRDYHGVSVIQGRDLVHPSKLRELQLETSLRGERAYYSFYLNTRSSSVMAQLPKHLPLSSKPGLSFFTLSGKYPTLNLQAKLKRIRTFQHSFPLDNRWVPPGHRITLPARVPFSAGRAMQLTSLERCHSPDSLSDFEASGAGNCWKKM